MYTNLEYLISFITYLSVVLIIGIVAAKRSSHVSYIDATKHNDFILGGRSVNFWLTALSAHAADMSDWLFMGYPAVIYAKGGFQVWIAIGLIIGMFCSWHFLAAKLRSATEKYNSLTLASYFKNRFDDTSGAIIALSAFIISFFMLIYIAASLKGIGYVLQSAFGIDYHIGTLIAVFVVVTYTCIGGFVSVAWIDLFQGLFLLCMLMLVALVAFFKVGGITSIVSAALSKNVSLTLFPDFTVNGIVSILLGPLAWGLGYFGMPHILTKFMGAKDPKEMYKSKYIGITWQFLALGSAILVGLVGLAYFTNAIPGKNEFIFIEMAKGLFIPWIAGFVLCAILAATISTVDSQLLVLAGIVAEDFYKNLLRKKASSKEVFYVYRITLIGAALAGFSIAWDEKSTIFGLVEYAWAGLGAAFGPLTLLSIYSNKINKYGAFTGILAGGFIAASWNFMSQKLTFFTIHPIVPGFLTGLVVTYLISILKEKRA